MEYTYYPPTKAKHVIHFNGWTKVYQSLWTQENHKIAVSQHVKDWLTANDPKAKIKVDRTESMNFVPSFTIFISNKKAAQSFIDEFGNLDQLSLEKRSVRISGDQADQVLCNVDGCVSPTEDVSNWLQKYASDYALHVENKDEMGTFVFVNENQSFEFTKYLARTSVK